VSLVSAITTLLIYSVEYNVLMINNSTSRILRYDQGSINSSHWIFSFGDDSAINNYFILWG